MNSRELKVAYKIYDLLSMRGRLDILDKVEDINVGIFDSDPLYESDASPLFNDQHQVTVRHVTVNGIKVTARITVDHLGQSTDELDSQENRLAYLTLDHLTGTYNG